MNLLLSLSFPQLQDLFVMLDEKLTAIHSEIESSSDPDSDGLFDQVEYFVGIGLVAAQQFLVEASTFARIEPDKAYKLGPRHSSGIFYVKAINTAANYWKHETELYKDLESLSCSYKKLNNVITISNTEHYPLSNFLFSLSNNSEVKLQHLIPILKDWVKVLQS